jgi:lipid-A-disaccharide synthase
MIIAGETSGDIIGGLLATEIKLLRPNIELFGLGGDRMDTAGVRLYYHVNQLAVLGFWEIIKHLPFMKVVERNILSAVAKHKPALAILIDYPGQSQAMLHAVFPCICRRRSGPGAKDG